MHIASWLRSLGLEQYTPAFSRHDIDAEVLPSLTAQDLIDIGVVPDADRLQLLEAIATLRSAPSAPLAGARAERRWLTVLFCDMVGSTALSAQLDPEDMREVIRRYHATCTRIAAQYDGHVANFIGDGLLVYFGWPQAQEDDGQRAVRAGLALLPAIAAMHAPSGQALAARIGVATGPVVVGDLYRDGPAQAQSAVGQTPDLAARLQALAEPGEVVVDASTRRLLGSAFDVTALEVPPSDEAAGHAGFRVRGERRAIGRFEARSGTSLGPMVGRERELGFLLDRWAKARLGQGQGVLIVGDAGIGKSRLCRAVLDAMAAGPCRLIDLQCSPRHTDSALWPVIRHFLDALKLGDEAPLATRLDRLEALVDDDRSRAALLAALLEIDGSSRYGTLALDSIQQRARTLDVLVDAMLQWTQREPVVLLVEDAQWIDPTTLDLIGRCLDRVGSARMLLLMTSRPDDERALPVHPGLARLVLQRLRAPALEAIVAHVAGGLLLATTIAMIVERTDGVPLFAEELTRATLETGGMAVPASLHGSLMARLDRMPNVKKVAQVAACIGREFDAPLLAAVSGQPPAELATAIEQLASAELVRRQGDPPRETYAFRHALLQEAAYESLLRSDRQQLHARILQRLEAGPPRAAHEVLAHHAARAGMIGRAAQEWGLAGRAALAKSAYVEAANDLGMAIELSRSAELRSDEARANELELQVALGQARMATSGYGAEVTRRSFERARELLDITHDKTLRLPVLYGLWAGNIMAVGPTHALQMGLDLLAAAEADADEETMLVAHRLTGSAFLECGRWNEAKTHLEQAVAIYDRDMARHSHLSSRYGMEPGAGAYGNLAVVTHVIGAPDRAAALAERARELADSTRNVNARAAALCECVNLAMLQHDADRFERDHALFLGLATANQLAVWRAYAVGMQAWQLLEAGRHAEAISGFEDCIDQLTDCSARVRIQTYEAGLAMALASTGRLDEAIRIIDDALEEGSRTQRHWFDAELWRMRGELALQGGHPERAAVECFEHALAVARAQGAKAWELRAAVSLARVFARQGRHAQARALLEPVWQSFTEGHATVDLREARSLLARLA